MKNLGIVVILALFIVSCNQIGNNDAYIITAKINKEYNEFVSYQTMRIGVCESAFNKKLPKKIRRFISKKIQNKKEWYLKICNEKLSLKECNDTLQHKQHTVNYAIILDQLLQL